jgi:hypothetical protein
MLHNQSHPIGVRQFFYEMKTPYPPDTKAFLYYFAPPEGLRIAGELRLRVTSCDDPASFDNGSDLLKPNGQLWSRPLCILQCKGYQPVYGKLREEGLVPDDLDAVLSTLTPRISKRRRGQILYTLNDTFIVDFSCRVRDFCVITEQGVEMLPFTGPFNENRENNARMPYTGAYTNHQLSILLD